MTVRFKFEHVFGAFTLGVLVGIVLVTKIAPALYHGFMQ